MAKLLACATIAGDAGSPGERCVLPGGSHRGEHPGEIEAAIGSSNVSRLTGPDPGTGPYRRSLARQKCERVRARIKHAAGGLEIRRVRDVFGLVEAAMSEQALVMGSL